MCVVNHSDRHQSLMANQAPFAVPVMMVVMMVVIVVVVMAVALVAV